MVTQVTSAPKSVSFEGQPAGDAVGVRSGSRLGALLARTDRAVTLNVGMLALLAVWLAGELIIEGTAYTLVAIVPAAPVFAGTVLMLRRDGAAPSWLLTSGVICALLTLLCAASFYGSLAMTPVDVSCAVSSALFGVVFGYGACYQLLRGSRGS